jgi:hypothetical protein
VNDFFSFPSGVLSPFKTDYVTKVGCIFSLTLFLLEELAGIAELDAILFFSSSSCFSIYSNNSSFPLFA